MSNTTSDRVDPTSSSADIAASTVRLLGLTVALVFWLVVATFPDFFFFNP